MSRQTISLGRILGIPVTVDYSWFLIFGLITWTLATDYYPGEFAGWPVAEYWLIGAVTALLFFGSVLLHELGHSVVALHYKIAVRRITLFIFGGVSQIESEPPSATAELWIAIAGPAVSLALAVTFGLLWFATSGLAPLAALTKYLAYINGSLFLFNLIPGFPLDGGRVFRAIIWGATRNFHRATLLAASVGRSIAYIFIFAGVWQMFSGHVGNGMWTAFIGWFLENAAGAQVQRLRLQDLLAGHTTAQAMNRDYTTIPAETTLRRLVDEHILGGGRRSFVVRRDNAAVGLLTLHHLRQVPQEAWSATTVGEIMLPLAQAETVHPDTDLWSAMEKMDSDGVNQLLVQSNEQVVGVLSREDLISFLRTLQALGV